MHKIYYYKDIYLAVGSLSLFFFFFCGGAGAAEESVKRIIEISEESQIKVSAEKSPSYLEVSQNLEVSKKSPNIEVPQKITKYRSLWKRSRSLDPSRRSHHEEHLSHEDTAKT